MRDITRHIPVGGGLRKDRPRRRRALHLAGARFTWKLKNEDIRPLLDPRDHRHVLTEGDTDDAARVTVLLKRADDVITSVAGTATSISAPPLKRGVFAQSRSKHP